MIKLNLKPCFKTAFVLLALVLCGAHITMAQTGTKSVAAKETALPKSALAITETFFKKYKDEGTGPAIDYLFATNKLFTDTAQISVLKGKLVVLRQTVGQYLGKELMGQKTAGTSLVFYSYLVKFENQPLRFTFMFYKPKAEWVLYHFKYDADLDAELEQAGKIK